MNIKVVTFNLRCFNPLVPTMDGKNRFPNRLPLIQKKIKKQTPDLICFQEVLPNQKNKIDFNLPNYELLGCPRGERLNKSEESVLIAVKRNVFYILGVDTFWLSPTPRVPGSRFSEDQSNCPRTCVVATLQHKKSGKIFRVYGTHTDHVGSIARQKGTEVILNRINEDNSFERLPFIVLGDLNASPNAREIEMLREFGMFDATEKSGYTFHDYKKPSEKIDYIFASPHFTADMLNVWTDERKGVYLSDHYPVEVTLSIGEKQQGKTE